MAEQEKGLVEYQSRDGQAIRLSFDTVRRYLVSGNSNLVTDQEIIFYMGVCKARGLNPFKKDCYLVKYTDRDNAAIIVSIDYYRSRARAQPDCRGWAAGIIVSKNGEPIYRKGSILYEGEKLLGGWFRGKPQNWDEAYEWTVEVSRYVKKKVDGSVTQFWTAEKQPEMIAKVAESQGLRKLWPDEFQGLFLKEEISEPLNLPAYKEPEEIESTRVAKSKKQSSKAEEKPAGLTALEWVKNAPEAEIMDAENLPAKLKGLRQSEQLEVTRAYNRRRDEIKEALKHDTEQETASAR